MDTAKKRAVAQRADIDTFNALVAAARLRPLAGGLRAAGQPSSKAPAARAFRADGTIASPAGSSSSGGSSSTAASNCAPSADEALRSGALFARAWRGAAHAARLDLLRAAAAAGALPRLLRLELSSRMLEELVACLEAALQAAEAGDAAAREAAAALAVATLQAARGAAGYAVAAAGLSLQARQRTNVLERCAV